MLFAILELSNKNRERGEIWGDCNFVVVVEIWSFGVKGVKGISVALWWFVVVDTK